MLLPIITGRGVKYTHNDIQHRILYRNRGPTRIRLVPTASDHEEIAPPHPDDPESIQGPGPAILTPQSLRCGHTISYPSGCYGDGAFELCLPSLGNHYQIYLLRYSIRSR